MIYLSGSTRQFFKRPDLFGVMFNTAQSTGKRDEALKAGCHFMVDNGIFSNLWTELEWLISLIYYYWPYRHNCLGVIIPDYLYYLPNGVRGDWQKTLERFYLYHKAVKRLGFKIAFATQDGQPIELVPWNDIDVLFIGGSNDHKRGKEAELLALEAKRRGIWVHVGRVSSVSKMRKLWSWADSYDGTTFRFKPDDKERELIPQIETYFKDDNKMRYHQYKLL